MKDQLQHDHDYSSFIVEASDHDEIVPSADSDKDDEILDVTHLAVPEMVKITLDEIRDCTPTGPIVATLEVDTPPILNGQAPISNCVTGKVGLWVILRVLLP